MTEKENFALIHANISSALESGPQRMTLVSFNSIGLPVCSHYTVYSCEQRSYAQYRNAVVLKVRDKGNRNFDEIPLHEGKAFALFLGWANSDPVPAETCILGYDKNRLYRCIDSITAPKLGENSERIYALERQNKPKIYKVVTMSPGDRFEQRVFNSLEELLKVYEQAGTLRDNVRRLELQGQPRLKGLYGPIYDGEENGAAVIRYESPEVYKILST